MSYKMRQKAKAASLIKETAIFNGDSGNGAYRGHNYPFVLSDSRNNLYSGITDDVSEYFEKNDIAWWGGKLTGHTLSSQIACLNHLFPLRHDKQAVLSITKNLRPEIADVKKIETDAHSPAYIQFEAVSATDLMNEGKPTRGRNCTSIDALIIGTTDDGRETLILIEWKYAEVYGNVDKGAGKSGEVRKSRYGGLIAKSKQLKNAPPLYCEPFYQLMRQTLWAEQMTGENGDFLHIHVIPPNNAELLDFSYKCSGLPMEETWRGCINVQNKYRIVAPNELLAPVDKRNYEDLFKYLNQRYWEEP
jgi:hypothetical protein